MKLTLLFLAGAMCLAALLDAPSVSAGQVVKGHIPQVVAQRKAQLVGHVAETNRLSLAIGLPIRNKEAFATLLAQIYDPASPNYRHYLTAAQYAQKFGPSEDDYQVVIAFANGHGLKTTAKHSNRMILDVEGTVADIQSALHVRLNLYKHPTEKRNFFAPSVEPTLDLAVPVLHISGLDNFVTPRSFLHKIDAKKRAKANSPSGTGSGTDGEYMGYDFRAAYAPGVTLTGAGQAVALFEIDSGFYQSDIANYEAQADLPSVPVTPVLLDNYDGSPGQANGEVSLDIEMAIAMAPGLEQVLVYEGNLPDDILNRIATDNIAKQISASWGYGIDPETEQIYQEFAAQGQSFFNASGDGDAWLGPIPYGSCEDSSITIVGGTTLTTTGPNGAWVSETVWNWDFDAGGFSWNPLGYVGSSGGISTDVSIPNWQTNINMSICQGSFTMRNVPDVALTADNIYVTYGGGASGDFGGTSCAAPLWAGFAALVNQQATSLGQPAVGFLNPSLYAIGQSPAYATAFNDTTNGNNTWPDSGGDFFAVPGYDLCTGWGTPAGQALIDLLAPSGSIAIYPNTGCTFTGNPGGPFAAASQVLILTNTGGSAISWALTSAASWLTVWPTNGALAPGGPAASVLVNLNPVATNLPTGEYNATVWFTNLNDSYVDGLTYALNVLGAPTIILQPLGQMVDPGFSETFTVAASGATPLNYSWLWNGIPTPRATNASFVTNNLTVADNGTQVSCVVSNTFGAVTSSIALLSVVSPPAIYSFNGPEGLNPWGGLVPASDGNFYGTAMNGGVFGGGTIYRMTPGGQVTNIYTFDYNPETNAYNQAGGNPFAGLIQASDGNLYGTCFGGGANDGGTAFKISTTGTLTSLASFSASTGWNPQGGLVQGSDGNFYGTTKNGGSNYWGSVFKMSPAGAITNLIWCNEALGVRPLWNLTQGSDGDFYGAFYVYGPQSVGTIFKVSPSGFLATLYSFNGSIGGLPSAGVIQGADGNFYGTASEGGSFGFGTVFKLTPSGTLTNLVSFNDQSPPLGNNPQCNLLASRDGNLYGTTVNGGAFGVGTVFAVNTNDGELTTLLSFDGTNGAYPQSSLIQGGDGYLYGTTFNGGIGYNPGEYGGNGVIYRVAPLPSPPAVVTAPINQRADVGMSVPFSITASGSPALSFQWQFDGVDITGATNSNYLLTDIAETNAGSYDVIITNGYGNVTSSVATLSILPAPTVTTYNNQPLVFFPSAYQGIYTLQMTTNLENGPWAPVTNGIPLTGMEVSNAPCNAFFQLSAVSSATVKQIAAGGNHTVLLKTDGSLWATGANNYGQLGNGTTNNTDELQEIAGSNVTSIAAGDNFTLLIKSDGSLWGMGENDGGELGDGTYNNADQPELILSSNVVAIAAGDFFTMFLKNDGSLWGMGDGGNGELGSTGFPGTVNRPIQVAGNVTAVACGSGHVLFLKNDGTLWGIGNNQYGELGDGQFNLNSPPVTTPVQVLASNVASFAGGAGFSMIIESNGSLWGTGFNFIGQLGNGTEGNANVPTQISTSNVVAVAGGADQTVFLQCNGSLWGTGGNHYGQLGLGPANNVSTPVELESSNVVAISAGSFFTVFAKTDGSVWSMGYNESGQLGDGTYSNTNVATEILPPTSGNSSLALNITTYNNEPVIFFENNFAAYSLLMSTNLATANWIPITNAVTFTVLQIPNSPSPVYFRFY